jgi:hypothetical protein
VTNLVTEKKENKSKEQYPKLETGDCTSLNANVRRLKPQRRESNVGISASMRVMIFENCTAKK